MMYNEVKLHLVTKEESLSFGKKKKSLVCPISNVINGQEFCICSNKQSIKQIQNDSQMHAQMKGAG